MHRAARSEQLAAWAVIDIGCRIKTEVGTREGAVLPVRPVKHRDMWCDALLFDKPVQHRSRTVSGIARKPFRLETEALLCSVDHCPGRADLSLANGAGCLNVNNDAELHVDEVVVGVSKKCGPLCAPIHCAAGSDGQRRWRRPMAYFLVRLLVPSSEIEVFKPLLVT